MGIVFFSVWKLLDMLGNNVFIFSGEEFDDIEDKATYKTMLARDQRRFQSADRDGDGIATREEFTAFLHPEEFDYMTGLVVQVESTHQEVEIIFFVIFTSLFKQLWSVTGLCIIWVLI